MEIKIKKLNTNATIPTYGTARSAGLDLYLLEDSVLHPGAFSILPTGVAASIPPGYVGLLRGRSSAAVKRGIVVAEGTIDSDYRGEIGVIATALHRMVRVSAGTRIAQMVVVPYAHCEVVESDRLDDTERGKGGFGSTGG